jgi:uncharacterized RDD family membrane protein YckC
MIFKRLIAFIIDILLIVIIMGALFVVIQPIKSPILLQSLSSLMLTSLFCKDCINGQSIGKRIMKIQVVDEISNKEVSNIRHIVRNIFVIFWMIDVFVLFISREKRLGDYVVKTRVICNKKVEKVQLNKNILYTALFCFCVIFLLLFVFYLVPLPILKLLFVD